MEFCSIQSCDKTTIDSLLRVYGESTADIFRKRYSDNFTSDAKAWAALTQDYTDFIAEFIAQDDRYIFAIKENGEYAAALRIIQMAEDGWYIEALETSPGYRRRGCARKLLKETLRCMRVLSARSIISVVDQNNTVSRTLHESCGFENAGGAAKDLEGNTVEGCILYRYSFKK